MGKNPRANKELGQHFLKDQSVIEGITQDYAQECDVIVEVGPGPAILSGELAKHDKPFYVIEMDARFIIQLAPIVRKEHIFMQNALEFNWQNFIADNKLEDKKIWLVSNLPYNISSPLYLSFMQIPQIKYMTLMFQKEVGEKTYLRQTKKNQMGSLLSLSMNYFDSKLLLKVLPGAFSPPPKLILLWSLMKEKKNLSLHLRISLILKAS